MIAVPSYQVIEFLDWIAKTISEKHRNKFFEEYFESERIVELARLFLYSKAYLDRKSRKKNSLAQQAISNYEDEYAEPINLDELSVEAEADRLCESVKVFVKNKEQLAGLILLSSEKSFLHFLVRISKTERESALLLEFLDWLKNNRSFETKEYLDNLSKDRIKDITSLFFQDTGYPHSPNLSNLIQKWLRDENDINIFEKFIKNISNNNHSYQSTGKRIIERYNSVKLHGIFLFLNSGDFPSFIKAHWEDLHYLSGNYIDIYYSEENLKNSISGHRILADFQNLSVKATFLPALVLWKDSLRDAQAINLDKLPHEEILRMMQQIVDKIQSQKDFHDIVEETSSWVKERLEKLGIIVRQKKIMVQEGDIINVNQAGAVGRYARSDNNTFSYSEQKQNFDETAKEIRKLLEKFEDNHPQATEDEKIAYFKDETAPSFKRRVSGLLKASGEAALDEFVLENKYLKVAKAALLGWVEPDS